ncbi:GNAT family N-acetyltransferase [Methanococcoides sp. LMO-2]|uniref:GNAT family N-acetyltransferase n=1 Tax=Methanococcoides cohabitans TaxID=3136559 RepID=A0ABU9KPY3_9EURY
MNNGPKDLEVNIRSTDETDIPLIMRFIKELADFEKLSDTVVATEEDLKRSLFGERPYAEAVIAEIDGSPAGFMIFFHNFTAYVGKPGIYIEGIYVDPAYRGSGVGEALMKYCAGIAKERGCGTMNWCVLDWNPARKFYERLGAKPESDWVVYTLDEKGISELVESKNDRTT